MEVIFALWNVLFLIVLQAVLLSESELNVFCCLWEKKGVQSSYGSQNLSQKLLPMNRGGKCFVEGFSPKTVPQVLPQKHFKKVITTNCNISNNLKKMKAPTMRRSFSNWIARGKKTEICLVRVRLFQSH